MSYMVIGYGFSNISLDTTLTSEIAPAVPDDGPANVQTTAPDVVYDPDVGPPCKTIDGVRLGGSLVALNHKVTAPNASRPMIMY
jgi:hypothetical protein